MGKEVWQLTVRSEFSAAHALRNFHGKCENTHGHNYMVEMTVEGEKLEPEAELLVDFSVLKTLLRQELQYLDHEDINQIAPFDRINPSSENLARHLWRQLQPKLTGLPVKLRSVTVSEKSTQSASYREMEA